MNTNPDIHLEMQGNVAVVRLTRPTKRNALNDGLIASLRHIFENLPKEARAAVVAGEGEHFCAGLDLSELKERDAGEGVYHSRSWHVALDRVQSGPVPVIAALHGAVVGGGLELASACHIRVADESTFYALPEGTRGIFVGGGGAVRIPRLIGVARMTDMMLTGRVYNAQDGERIGMAQYLVPTGTAFEKASKYSKRILVEKHAEGADYRLDIFNGELLWVVERIPASVTGDGKSSVAALVAGGLWIAVGPGLPFVGPRCGFKIGRAHV